MTRTELSLTPLAELLPRLSEQALSRVPKETIGAFVSESHSVAYPIIGRIVSFLETDVIPIERTSAPVTTDPEADMVKRSVREWYDQFGWQKNQEGLYSDSAIFSQDQPVGHGLYELSSNLSLIDRLKGGEFVLDAGSGAIPHPEYLAFSWFYQFRICVDMSMTALQEANAKIGDRCYCCLADVTQLPFRDNSIDGVVSAHLVQHIPDSQQQQAVRELYRVLHPGCDVCVITVVDVNSWHQALFWGFRGIRKLLRAVGIVTLVHSQKTDGQEAVTQPPHKLYSSVHDWKWWRQFTVELSEFSSVECLRLFSKYEYEWVFGQSTRAAKLLRVLESAFPQLLARASKYCLVSLHKPS